jgi:hydrogenase maturation protein HypF
VVDCVRVLRKLESAGWFVATTILERRRLLIQGIVQGVGFRPFVYRQALRWQLAGFVLNDSNGVTIEAEGAPAALDSFQQALRAEAPPLARIDSLNSESIALRHEAEFVIALSRERAGRHALISPDIATCEDCLSELHDPRDRRFHYPFINCTNCGPRFSIVQDVPYDRPRTTMRVFPLCPECQNEYDDPLHRRFHAQPNACAHCGPRARLLSWSTRVVETDESIEEAARWLAEGAILAIKGLGGYHLACDALNAQAVERLRARKQREARPFALMVPDLETARQLCQVNEAEANLLQARQRPIVLLSRLPDCPVAAGVAPELDTLGLLLPYTPLHHLLLHAFSTVYDRQRPVALVMTSGNLSDEPIAYQDEEASARLAAIADGALTHNREICTRCDDSVVRVTAVGEQFFRRSRGYAPEPLALPIECPVPLLACGGHLKNTFCLGKGDQAFISHHIGDLENLETLTSFRAGIAHFQQLFAVQPEAVVFDLHPEYLATKYALETGIARQVAVQHHHAHVASVLAEHGLDGPVIGVVADGTGYGADGAIWGCEIMRADLLGFERLAHLAYVPLPGGEQAVRQPWRMAAVYLHQAYGDAFLGLDIPFTRQFQRARWPILERMIARGLHCPRTSSLGRLFDAVAALLGVREEVCYEGQAAIELEALAARADVSRCYPFLLGDSTPIALNAAPMIRALVDDLRQGVSSAQIARNFHASIVELFAMLCLYARECSGLTDVALSGGVFQNRLLLEGLAARLAALNFQVYTNRRVPPNDGGLSLGQAAIAAARLRKG